MRPCLFFKYPLKIENIFPNLLKALNIILSHTAIALLAPIATYASELSIESISIYSTSKEEIKHKKLTTTKKNCKNVKDNTLVSNIFELLKFLYKK